MTNTKKTICLAGLLAGIILILATGFLPFFIVRKSFCAGQQNIIGVLYEKDAVLCKEILRYTFEENPFSKETEAGKEAMVSLGYTQKGISYLFQKTGWDKIYLTVFSIQCLLVLILFFFLLWLEKQKQEEQDNLILEIRKALKDNCDLSLFSCTFLKKSLLDEISGLLRLLHTKEKFLLEKNSRTQAFIENIAHQIKTPLSCISISMDLMLETADYRQKEPILDCFHHLERIQILMKKLLDIGRLEAGKILMQKEPIQIEDLLKECADALPDGDKRILFSREDEDKRPKKFFYCGDYEWLKEAFLNILKNCLEHDKSNEKILLILSQTAEGIKITIKDHGEGIVKEDLPHIFDRFYLPKQAKESHFGIGLNLAKLIIDQHFGSIHAANSEDGGAIFTVLLPVFGFLKPAIRHTGIL